MKVSQKIASRTTDGGSLPRNLSPGGGKRIFHAAARTLFSGVVFAVSLAATASLIARVAGRTPVPEFSDKLADVVERKDGIDVLFLGSSRVRRQISPRIFDSVLRERGMEVQSYNFGLDGLGVPEIAHVADEIIAVKPPRLKYVFIELTRFAREFGALAQPDSPRSIYWHTPRYATVLCQAIWSDPASVPVKDRLSLIGDHAEIALRRVCNLGRGVEIFEHGGKLGFKRKRMGPEADGFFPVNEQFPKGRRAEYEKQLAALPAVLNQPPTTEPLFAEVIHDLLGKLQRAGITPVIVTMPRIHPAAPWVPEADGSGPGWIVLRFDDPAKHPDLFDARLHYDPQHLNGDGAKVFSRVLAEEFAAKVQAHPLGAVF
jgi:hypothetical protein